MDNSDHFINIYRNHAQLYHEMIRFEDADDNLRPALESITPFHGRQILDLGTGTGRIPLLYPEENIIGIDLHSSMLQENISNTKGLGLLLVQGDIRSLPFPGSKFDIVTAGWVIGHFTGWYPDGWKAQATQVLNHAFRIIRPGGWIIILETLTTGSNVPAPPSPSLEDYYGWLETKWGFSRKEIQTDYQFELLAQSEYYARFFFGQELADRVRKNHWVRLPEWTGVWYRQIKIED